jgi:crossover junction endodeoxyribonuclease RuvC
VYSTFIGIDPGKSGGIAVLSDNTSKAFPMPETERDISSLFQSLFHPHTFAIIEKVHSAPQQGVASVFTFGANYGFLRGCLCALGFAFDEVRPIEWQTKLNCKTGGDKNVTKAKAQQLFPGIKVTHAIADALLIAEYNRRFYNSVTK